VSAGRRRNDPAQYDELVDHWWRHDGEFAALHWLAASRAERIPAASRPDAVLVDLACGGGLMAPHAARLGYRHVGVDLGAQGLRVAREHGVLAVRGTVLAVPLADGCADVVVAGEILEHVPDLAGTVREACRLLRPGGLLVIDTLAATALGRFVAVTLAERLPGGPPPGIHDPALFVDRAALVRECARHGVDLRLRGIRPSMRDLVRWLRTRRGAVRMVPAPTTAVLFQAVGRRR